MEIAVADNLGIEVLTRSVPDLHKSRAVDKVVRRARRSGEKVEEQKKPKVERFVKELEKYFGSSLSGPRRERNFEMIKKAYLRKVVIAEEDIPESYFENQVAMAEAQGLGRIPVTERMRHESWKIIAADQEFSLGVWFNYLDSESAPYPAWFKFWLINGVSQLKPYDLARSGFEKRDAHTVALFPDLNMEVVSKMWDKIKAYYLPKLDNRGALPQVETDVLLERMDFGKIYAEGIREFEAYQVETGASNDGQWKVFHRGSAPDELVNSLLGQKTGWCTAGMEVARSQLELGDFYVYYTKDALGKYSKPRVAVRMSGVRVAEVRGIGEKQNMEPEMVEVAQKMYRSLPGGMEFDKKTADMKMVTELKAKVARSQKLTADDLIFLWEIKEKIMGFGYVADPRINELRKTRDFDKDWEVMRREVVCMETVGPALEKAIREASLYGRKPEIEEVTLLKDKKISIQEVLRVVLEKKDVGLANLLLEKLNSNPRMDANLMDQLVSGLARWGDEKSWKLLWRIVDRESINWVSEDKGDLRRLLYTREKKVNLDGVRRAVTEIDRRLDLSRGLTQFGELRNRLQRAVVSEKAVDATNPQIARWLSRLRESDLQMQKRVNKVLPLISRLSKSRQCPVEMELLERMVREEDRLESLTSWMKFANEVPEVADYLFPERDSEVIAEEIAQGDRELKDEVIKVIGFGWGRSATVDNIIEAKQIAERNRSMYKRLDEEMGGNRAMVLERLWNDAQLKLSKKKDEAGKIFLSITVEPSADGTAFHPWGMGIYPNGEMRFAVLEGRSKMVLKGMHYGRWSGVYLWDLIGALEEKEFRKKRLELAMEAHIFGRQSWRYILP